MDTPTNYIIHSFGNDTMSIVNAFALNDHGQLMMACLTDLGRQRKREGMALLINNFDWNRLICFEPDSAARGSVTNAYIFALRSALQAKELLEGDASI
jgi:hypothetical protein